MDILYLVDLIAAMLLPDAALTLTLAPVIVVRLALVVVVGPALVVVVRLVLVVVVRLVLVTAIRLDLVVPHRVRTRQRLGSAAESITERIHRGRCCGDDQTDDNVGEERRETRKHDRKQE